MVGFDEDRDVAVLKIAVEETATLPKALKRRASKKLDVGQKVFAIGNPFGLDHTLRLRAGGARKSGGRLTILRILRNCVRGAF